MSGTIFISHSHDDKPLADALAGIIGALFGDRIAVRYSSSKEEGGIAAGEDWFRWIVEQVREADLALILLTPGSVTKPWVIWEAGAVAGAAFATSMEKTRLVPITFGVKGSNVPGPLTRLQVVSGTDQADVTKLLSDLFERFGSDKSEGVRFGRQLGSAVTRFASDAAEIMLRLPLAVSEAGIAEWINRIDELVAEDRASEAAVIESWLDIAYGRDASDQKRPLDVRIHRRLGELYAQANRPDEAVRQFQLARQLSPRDIFILRRLGKAYLDLKDLVNSEKILSEISSYDEHAFDRNIENAALKARWHEQRSDLSGARDILRSAYQNFPTSYYLGDRLGQLLIKLNEPARAKEVYEQVRRTIGELRERNVWTESTALTAAVVCDDPAGIAAAVDGLRAQNPSREQLQSVERGVQSISEALGRDTSLLITLRNMERGTA